jgi:protein ImuA
MHDVVNPLGLQTHCDPHQVLIGKCSNPTDVLAATEDALRSGVVSLVIAELTKPLSLTAGRRLQLAAEVGGSTGLMIVSDGMGSNATQTRWHVSPVYSSDDSTQMRWSLIKNKSGTNGCWDIRWDETARRISVVSQPVERARVAQAFP